MKVKMMIFRNGLESKSVGVNVFVFVCLGHAKGPPQLYSCAG